MRFRQDYVTNSSSSSYIVVAKVNDSSELRDYFKEEYGKYGIKMLDRYLLQGSKIINSDRWAYGEFKEYCQDNNIEIEENSTYLQAEFYTYDTEGDGNGDDAWLWEQIPDKFMEKLYEGE